MGHALLFSEVLGSLTISVIIFCLLIIAAVSAYNILRRWDFSSSTEAQYRLEKSNFFISLAVKSSFYIKLFLFLYFFYILQMLSDHLPGAMCAAGVVNANIFGAVTIFFQILTLFTGGLWIYMDRYDLRSKCYDLTLKKQQLFIIFFIFIIFELLSTILFFYQIDLNMVVQCCSIIYGIGGEVQQGPIKLYPFEYPLYLGLVFAVTVVVDIFKRDYLTIISNILFLFISFLAIVHFYSPYIYQLPAHHCPYCLLQAPYFYIGYPLFGLLFLSVFFPLVGAIGRVFLGVTFFRWVRRSVILKILLLVLLNSYPLFYFWNNGVLLFPLK